MSRYKLIRKRRVPFGTVEETLATDGRWYVEVKEEETMSFDSFRDAKIHGRSLDEYKIPGNPTIWAVGPRGGTYSI